MNDPIPQDIKPLTSLRFLAALMIVFYHYFIVFGAVKGWDFFGKFYLGVDFFFILSGFILLHVYSESLLTNKFNIKSFYIKRLAKIYPVHLFLTAVAAFLVFSTKGFTEDSWKHLLSHILLVHGWGIEKGLGYNMPSWSVSAEWFAYLLFPFLSALFLKFRQHSLILLGGSVLLFVLMWLSSSFWVDRPLTHWTYDFSCIRILPEFLMGMAIYNFMREKASCKYAQTTLLLSLIVSAGLIVFQAPDFITVLSFAVLIYVAASLNANGCGWSFRVLSCKPFTWLGEISYCLYMVHQILFIQIMNWWLKDIASIFGRDMGFYVVLPALYVGLTIVSAAVLYYVIERPARTLITSFAKA